MGKIQTATANMPTQNGQPSVQNYVKKMLPEITKALPSVMTPERFSRIVLSALSSNPKLAACSPQSFLGAMMIAAQLGLEPNTPLGQAYLIPYGGQCQFQLGYKGMLDLAYRSGNVSIVQAHVVYENDTFDFAFGLEPTLKHVPARTNRGEPIYVYGMFKSKDGGFGFDVMSIEDVREHAKKFSKSYNSGPWQTNFEEMAKKTILKRVLKYAPMKSDFVRAMAQDETVKSTISSDMFDVQDDAIQADFEVVEQPEVTVNENTGEVLASAQ